MSQEDDFPLTREGVRIEPESFYDDAFFFASLGLGDATIRKARKSGLLKFIRKGQVTLYRGQWILDWLLAEETNGSR